MMLQGSPITYYGDEIGMTDNDKIQINSYLQERDPYRTPMQWDDTANAGKSHLGSHFKMLLSMLC